MDERNREKGDPESKRKTIVVRPVLGRAEYQQFDKTDQEPIGKDALYSRPSDAGPSDAGPSTDDASSTSDIETIIKPGHRLDMTIEQQEKILRSMKTILASAINVSSNEQIKQLEQALEFNKTTRARDMKLQHQSSNSSTNEVVDERNRKEDDPDPERIGRGAMCSRPSEAGPSKSSSWFTNLKLPALFGKPSEKTGKKSQQLQQGLPTDPKLGSLQNTKTEQPEPTMRR